MIGDVLAAKNFFLPQELPQVPHLQLKKSHTLAHFPSWILGPTAKRMELVSVDLKLTTISYYAQTQIIHKWIQ